ncbi:MAG: BCD family MFS transporter [Pseudomonadales bacterium]
MIGRGWQGMWTQLAPGLLPFADAASPDLPLLRLLRLALFQVSAGMVLVLLNGTLNRVMIVELGVSASLVSLMVALPLVFAPFRALIGFRSDQHRSFLGWRRVPYIWMGTLLQFGGLAIMPFALLVLTGDGHGPAWAGALGAALAFLLIGAGMHTAQTAGLALATDLAPAESRPRVVALLYVMLLAGTVVSALAFSVLLEDFSHLRLIQVIQGCALVCIALNVAALWKQEPRNPDLTRHDRPRIAFREAWRSFDRGGRLRRLLVATGLGTAGFGMQDILLEPYGGEVLRLGVADTTLLTALLAGGTLAAFAWSAQRLNRGVNVYRLASLGALVGVLAFSAVIFSAPLESPALFRVGTVLIGFGGGLFAVGSLVAVMALSSDEHHGMALGAWGAVQACALGGGIAIGGALRDAVSALAASGSLGTALMDSATGYVFVYHLEIALLFVTLVAIGPLVRVAQPLPPGRFGLAEFPG